MLPKIGIYRNVLSNLKSNNTAAVNNMQLRQDTVSFGNGSVISSLAQKNFREFCEDLYRQVPEKCQILLNNKSVRSYLDGNTGCFSDEYAIIKRENMEAFKNAVEKTSSDDMRKIMSSVEAVRPHEADYTKGQLIAKALILHGNDKAAYDYIIKSPAVYQEYVCSSGYSPDLFLCIGNYPERVVDNMSLGTVKEIEKGIKHNYYYGEYTGNSDYFSRNEKKRKELSEFLSSQKLDDDITAYRGERSTWMFESVPVDKSLAKQVRLLAFLNPDSRKTKIFPNAHMYSSEQTQSIYDYLKSKDELSLADAMLVAKYGNGRFIKRLTEEINNAGIQDASFKSFTLDKNFASNWANNYGHITSPTIVSKTVMKKGTQAGYDAHSGGRQFEFVMNDNLKNMTFSNARYDKATNTFYMDSNVSAVEK